MEETRKNTKAGAELEDAINSALSDMPEDFLIKKLLMGNKAEVMSMCITEYNEAKTLALYGAERERRGTIKAFLKMIQKGLITEDEAASEANMSVDEFRRLAIQFA